MEKLRVLGTLISTKVKAGADFFRHFFNRVNIIFLQSLSVRLFENQQIVFDYF